MNKTEIEVLGLLLRSPTEGYTSYQIAKRINKYISQVQKAINSLQEKEIINNKKVGIKAKIWKLDFSHADIDFLCLSSIALKQDFLESNLKVKAIMSEIDEKLHGSIDILILFGSYARDDTTKDSDMDLCILLQSKKEIDNFRSRIESVLERFSYKIHLNIFTIEDFFEMLKEKNTVGREILKNGIVLHGFDAYFRMVKRYDKEHGY